MATSHITHIPATYPGTSISPTPSLEDIGEAIELSRKPPCLHPVFGPTFTPCPQRVKEGNLSGIHKVRKFY